MFGYAPVVDDYRSECEQGDGVGVTRGKIVSGRLPAAADVQGDETPLVVAVVVAEEVEHATMV